MLWIPQLLWLPTVWHMWREHRPNWSSNFGRKMGRSHSSTSLTKDRNHRSLIYNSIWNFFRINNYPIIQRLGFLDSINECLKCFAETSDASKALRLLRFHDNSANIERTLLTFLANNPTSYKAAILGLPRDVRTMFVAFPLFYTEHYHSLFKGTFMPIRAPSSIA